MKIQIESSRLAKACAWASKNIPSKPLLPIMGNLYIVANNDVISITSTDNEVWTMQSIPATVVLDDTPSAFCINAANLTSLLQAIPSQPIVIELKARKQANEYGLPCFYATIKHSSGTSELPVGNADEYPSLNPVKGVDYSVSAEVLKQSIETCRFALLPDATLYPQMASLCLHFKGNSMVAVATDKNIIARLENPDVEGPEDQFMLPKKCLSLVMPAIDDLLKDKQAMDVVLLRREGNRVCIQMDSTAIYCLQTEMKYPKYDSVIPDKKYFVYEAVVNRKDMLSAIMRAALFTNAESMKLDFEFHANENYVDVVGECIDFATSSKERVTCEFKGEGNFKIAFRATYLKDLLSHLSSEEVRFYMINHSRQTVIAEEHGNPNVLMLIMPMILNY